MEDCWVWFMTYFVFYSPELVRVLAESDTALDLQTCGERRELHVAISSVRPRL